MSYSRREFGKLALAGCRPRRCSASQTIFGAFVAQSKPNSLFNGVPDRRDHLQLSQHARSERRGDAQYLPRLGPQRLRVDGRPRRDVRRPPAGAGARRRTRRGRRRTTRRGRSAAPGPGQKIAEWHGQQCLVSAETGAPLPPAGFGGGRGRGQATPEQIAEQQEAAKKLKDWRTSVSMDQLQAVA